MKTKITCIALALMASASVFASTPTTWSDLKSKGGLSEKGEVCWGDYNNDGKMDLFQISGNVFALFQNGGDSTFTNVTDAKFTVKNSRIEASASFLDYNNDGNLDLLVMGWSNSTKTLLYKNSGAPDYKMEVDSANVLVNLKVGGDGASRRVISATDYNLDGWTDLFLEGWCDDLNTRVVALYKNNKGIFERVTKPVNGVSDFLGMNSGSLHTADMDNDGLVDLITSGYAVQGGYQCRMYLNNGDGTFKVSKQVFPGVEQGEVLPFDVNNDGWQDVVVMGVTNDGSWSWPGDIYLNNQDSTFTKKANVGLPTGKQFLEMSAGDFNNDGTSDLMLMLPSGFNGNTGIFYNNGDSTFTETIPHTGARARGGALAAADFNNDNKLDYFAFGWRDSYTFADTTMGGDWSSYFAMNTCAVANTVPTVPTNISATQVNGKWVISWNKSTDDHTAQSNLKYNVYIQDASGMKHFFVPADASTGKLKVGAPTLMVKNELKVDLGLGTYVIGVQAVDGAFASSSFGTFNLDVRTPIATWSVLSTPGELTDKGETIWGDYNNDGNIDMFELTNNRFALFKNNGDETFTNVTAARIADKYDFMTEASAVFFDYNNDDNLDLLVMGRNGSTITRLYKNLGAPDYNFAPDTTQVLLAMRTGSDNNSHRVLSTVDVDHDGWMDLFVEGWCDQLNTRVVTLYKNVNGKLTRTTTPVGGTEDFLGMNAGSLHTGDVNNDGLVDMISTGYAVTDKYVTNLYLNQGNGRFAKSTAAFQGIEQGEAMLFDSNSDGWLDVFVMGVGHDGSNWVWPGSLYINNQDGTFTKLDNTGLPNGTQKVTLSYGDFNNDGFNDVMYLRTDWGFTGNTSIYYNNGDNTYRSVIPPTTARARGGSMNVADFNNDNNLDYYLFGWRDGYTTADNVVIDGGWASTFAKNTCPVLNLAPSAPLNVTAVQNGDTAVISWNKSTDAITPQNAIRYNLYVQNAAGAKSFIAAADATTGRLKVGNPTLLSNNQIKMKLGVGEYTVGVQAVDQSFATSTFTTASLSIATSLKEAVESKVFAAVINHQIVVKNISDKVTDVLVYAMNGQLVYRGKCVANATSEMPVTLSKGIYLVKLSNALINKTVKLSVM
ncbi:MAG TPA: T9SS type A sorting domain-containing protein [Bacteroidales bacterium]|nr:T9SS type A sorting domain-containing protein [Bacteroidales bacterium]